MMGNNDDDDDVENATKQIRNKTGILKEISNFLVAQARMEAPAKIGVFGSTYIDYCTYCTYNNDLHS